MINVYVLIILDVDLMPGLAKACRRDMTEFCHDATNNDQIIPCLKKNIEVRQIFHSFRDKSSQIWYSVWGATTFDQVHNL